MADSPPATSYGAYGPGSIDPRNGLVPESPEWWAWLNKNVVAKEDPLPPELQGIHAVSDHDYVKKYQDWELAHIPKDASGNPIYGGIPQQQAWGNAKQDPTYLAYLKMIGADPNNLNNLGQGTLPQQNTQSSSPVTGGVVGGAFGFPTATQPGSALQPNPVTAPQPNASPMAPNISGANMYSPTGYPAQSLGGNLGGLFRNPYSIQSKITPSGGQLARYATGGYSFGNPYGRKA